MDLLELVFGYDQFMLFGLCSGADDAVVAALEDTPIVGVSLTDGCGYRTPRHSVGFVWRKYVPKIFTLRKWWDLVIGVLKKQDKSTLIMPQGLDIREFPDQEQSVREITMLIDRGVKLQFCYTNGVIDYYNYERKFYDMFPTLQSRDEISVSYHPQWNHTVKLREDREEFVLCATQFFVTANNANGRVESGHYSGELRHG
jgi:hypothetical protein